MECNKEEAFRAKAIAEKKMLDKDFLGARKFALKAQQLYPDVENMSQMMCVCDVHCSAENKGFGNELDWYSILQIEQTADETLIKKQYRKFALLLHPDKNKFAGAEAAFKLIGEAQRVLLDREKRSFYDMKRRTSCKPVIPNQPSQQGNWNYNVGKQSRVQHNFTSNPSSHFKGFNPPHQGPKKQAQPGVANGKETFWTMCPSCKVLFQYYKGVLNEALRCQSCKKPFIAHDVHSQGGQPGYGVTQPVFPRQGVPNVGSSKLGSGAMKEKPVPNPGFQSAHNADFSRSQKTRQSHNGSNEADRERKQGSKSSRKVNGKRGKKQVVESSESFESDSSLDSDEVEVQQDGEIQRAQQYGIDGDHHPRRSSRNKVHVSYNENVSDSEETLKPSKRAKVSELSSPVKERNRDASEKEQASDPSKLFGSAFASVKESRKGERNKCDGSESVAFEGDNGCELNSSPETTPDPTFHDCPDPEFSDFDKDREEHCFKVGQLWATYDTVDAMPRFYARIRRVYSPGFKLRISWLEPDPDEEAGRKWANSELPFSCGKFKNGNSENTEDRLMFSHMVSWESGSGRDSVEIFPRKGETWALFKNWDAKWCLIQKNAKEFEYEFVEVLSEYDRTLGIWIAYLGKLKGFASLFCRKGGDQVRISPAEVLRFSHRVPSCRMTGYERQDVPSGSFELDPASITMNLEEIAAPKLGAKSCMNDLSAKFAEANAFVGEKSGASFCDNQKGHQMEQGDSLDVDVIGQSISDSQFSNFGGMKSIEKFQVDQVWALYGDVDGLPKYYGVIKKIDSHPGFTLHVACVEVCYLPTDIILWKSKEMPISCGQFKIKAAKVQTYTSNSSFSHQLQVNWSGRKNLLSIYPQKGEVWALYKNWDASMEVSDLKNCEYDIVEVLEEIDALIKVLVLEDVHGHNSVFKPQKNGASSVTREISRVELLRFSHQIPSFRLKDEKCGSLRGFWELDPAALPSHMLYKSK